jgi:glycerophosphoryl diester phosphodiesterase
MISLRREDGRVLRIGHRGAAALAPENTIESFRAAVEIGVDLVEFDVVGLADRALVVAHGVRDVGPHSPTLDEALEYFVGDAPAVGVHVDLKIARREHEIVAAVRRLGLESRTLVSSANMRSARRVAAASREVRAGITIPRGVLGISDSGRGATLASAGLGLLRSAAPALVGSLLSLTRAGAVVMHHSIVTRAAVESAHARDCPVVAWTVDLPEDLERVDRAGVDAVVTNDPRIFASTMQT